MTTANHNLTNLSRGDFLATIQHHLIEAGYDAIAEWAVTDGPITHLAIPVGETSDGKKRVGVKVYLYGCSSGSYWSKNTEYRLHIEEDGTGAPDRRWVGLGRAARSWSEARFDLTNATRKKILAKVKEQVEGARMSLEEEERHIAKEAKKKASLTRMGAQVATHLRIPALKVRQNYKRSPWSKGYTAYDALEVGGIELTKGSKDGKLNVKLPDLTNLDPHEVAGLVRYIETLKGDR